MWKQCNLELDLDLEIDLQRIIDVREEGEAIHVRVSDSRER